MQPDNLATSVLQLIASFSGQTNTLTIPRIYIEWTGSLDTALFLSQCIYWSDRSTMENGWFAKSYEDWEAELGLSTYVVKKAAAALADAGLETVLKKFAGAPTVHYRIDTAKFYKWICKFLQIENEIFNNPLQNLQTEPTNIRKKDSKKVPVLKKQKTAAARKTKTKKAPPPSPSRKIETELEQWLEILETVEPLVVALLEVLDVNYDRVLYRPKEYLSLTALKKYCMAAAELQRFNATPEEVKDVHRYLAPSYKRRDWVIGLSTLVEKLQPYRAWLAKKGQVEQGQVEQEQNLPMGEIQPDIDQVMGSIAAMSKILGVEDEQA